MEILMTITDRDVEALKKFPVSVSRILNQAADLLEGRDMNAIMADEDVTVDYLRQLEPLLNRLFSYARASLIKE
jgi:hypothetical protein